MTQTIRGFRAGGLRALVALGILSISSVAAAQTQPAPTEPPPVNPPTTQPPPAPAPPPVDPNAPPVVTPPATTTPAAPEPKWYDIINFGGFVDGYYSQNWNLPRNNTNANTFQPYTANSGFNLSWVGLDFSVDPQPVGAVMQLRFGPSVPNLALGDFAIPGGIGFLQNAYVSWKPQGKDGKLTLILGKFDTVYGAEVAQSHLNLNYTRGYLYNLAQPFFHTGLRADYVLSDLLTFKLLAVNGWNNTIDNNQGKSFGAQVSLNPSDKASIALGWMGGPEENNTVTIPAVPATATDPGSPASTGKNVGADSRWRHLVDLVGDFHPTKELRVVVNGDYVTQAAKGPTNNDISQSWYGAALFARYQLTDMFAAAIRGEIIKDNDGVITAFGKDITLETATLTLEAAPHKHLLIRLDNRLDAASEDVFTTLNTFSKTQFTTTLGVVAQTN